MIPHPEQRLVERYETLTADGRDELLLHAAGCPSCRALIAERDPSRLFALLAVKPVAAGDLDRLSAGLDRQLDQLTPRRRGSRGWRSVASIAASLLLAGIVGLPALRHAPDSASARVEAPSPATVAVQRTSVPAAAVQFLSTPGEAQVMELAIGETQVVMIFDEALDI